MESEKIDLYGQAKTLRQKLQLYLISSYCYYIRYYSILTDSQFDQLAKDLYSGWGELEHQHKWLVTQEDLKAGTLYGLKEESYPMIVRQAGEIAMRRAE